MESAEHKAIVAAIDDVLQELADSALVGVSESQRRTFDYACLLKRDLGRPLVAQVLWRNEQGLEKDLRTLLFDSESMIKLYILRDSARVRSTFDDILASYRQQEMREKMAGLKPFFIAPDFDAGQEQQLVWLRKYLAEQFSRDVAFGILFGGLTKQIYDIFLQHDGPFGLKYAILHEIAENGLIRMPIFKERLGYSSNGPIREALTMLNATGLIRRFESCCFPTIRGRLLLDLTRRLLLDIQGATGWSASTVSLFRALGVELPSLPIPEIDPLTLRRSDTFTSNLLHIRYCESEYRRSLLAGIDPNSISLHSDFVVDGFLETMRVIKDFPSDFFSEPEYLYFPQRR